jgi:C4-dicarboxylate-specific signal transduction histidine kinase
MAAALAHELSQPLAAVTNSANAARRLLAQSGREQMEVVGDILSEIAEQSLRAGQIMHRLRDFVTRGESEKRVENVKTLIHEASAFARIGLDLPDVRLHVAIEPEATCVFVNRIQIQQVLVNLMRNAFEAVADIQHPELHIATSSMSGDGGMIEVLVVDNGPGLSSDIADRLFEPFVSTRPDGMGLGLAISRSIVEAHGGRLCYAPSLDRGSVFRFTLPSAGPSRQGYGQ